MASYCRFPTVIFSLFLLCLNNSNCEERQRPVSSLPTFPNIGYLGRGYDIFYGNPSNTVSGTDPGFRMQVLNFVYGTETTPDRRYRVPDGIEVLPAESCSISFTSSIIQTSSEYVKKLSYSVGGGFSFKTKIFKVSLPLISFIYVPVLL